MSGWGCVHEMKGMCDRMKRPCDPGMPGCLLAGRFRFSNPDKNRRRPPDPIGPDSSPSDPDPAKD